MALEPTEIPLSFSGGVDLKTDPKQILPSKFQELDNGVFTSLKRLKKRNGFTARSQTIDAGGSVSAGRGIFAFQNETLLADGTSLYSLIASSAKWSSRGALVSTAVSTSPVLRSMNQPSAPDSAVNAGLALHAWEDSAGGVYYSVIDTATGAPLVDRVLVSSTATRPKTLAIGSLLVLFVADGGNLYSRTINVATPTTISGASAVAVLASSNNYDACVYSTTNVFVFSEASIGGFVANKFNASMTFVNALSSTGVGDTPSGCLAAIPVVANSELIFAYYNGTAVKFRKIDAALTTYGSITSVETIANVVNLGGVYNSPNVQLYYSISASSTMNYVLNSATLAGSSYTPTANGVLVRSVGLFAKPFLYNATVFLPVAFVSTLQSSYFVMRSDTVIVAKLTTEAGLAGGFSTRNLLGEVTATSASAFQLGHVVAESQFAQAGSIQVINGLNATTVDFADLQRSFASAELGGVLQFAGGTLQMYDRGKVVEHGFHVYPEGVTVATYPITGSLGFANTLPASYSWAVTYEWLDEQGKRHRSAPALVSTSAESVNFVGSTTSGSALVAVTTDDINRLFEGMSIAGPGIPASTTIASFGPGANQVTLSANATATQTNVPLLAQMAGFTLSATVNATKNVVVTSPRVLWVYGLTTNGSNQVTVLNPAGLAANQFIFAQSGCISGTITAVNGSVVTCSATASATTTTPQLLAITYAPTSGTVTSGTNTVTGVSAQDVAYAASHIGAVWYDGVHFATNPTIVSAAGSTITVSANATGTGSAGTARIGFAAGLNLVVGMQVSGTGITAGTTISAISTPANSAVTTITLSGYPTTGTSITVSSTFAWVTIPTLRLTRKSAVQVVVYRTQANGTIWNRVSSATSPVFNQTNIDSFPYVDTTADVTANGDDLLYTTGGVLENIPAPPSIGAAVSKDRVFLLDATDRKTVWYSKQVTVGAPVEFNDALTLTVDPRGTDLTAVSTLDDKAILWKRNGIYFLAGQGPDSTGGQNDFLEAVQVATDTGCIEPRSIVRIPSGLMYKSDKGIYLLDRSLSVSYIGADVEAYNSRTIVSATLVEGTTQVRFVLADSVNSTNTILVYDYFVGQWVTFTATGSQYTTNAFLNPVAAVVSGGVYEILRSDGSVVFEDSTTKLDLGSIYVPLYVKSAWLALAGLQGFQRFYEVLVLGEYVSPHTLNVLLSFDYVNSPTSLAIDVPSAPSSAYQFRFKSPIQRCEAVQIEIADTQDAQSPGTGEGFSLSAITLKVGKKRGPYKLPAAQTTG